MQPATDRRPTFEFIGETVQRSPNKNDTLLTQLCANVIYGRDCVQMLYMDLQVLLILHRIYIVLLLYVWNCYLMEFLNYSWKKIMRIPKIEIY